jgi:hypothetical protein
VGILTRLFFAAMLAFPWQTFAYTLTCDNGTNHRYYEIVGSPWGRVRVESSGSRKGVRYQYHVKIDDNESTPNTFQWRMRRWSPPVGEWSDNTTGVQCEQNSTIIDENNTLYSWRFDINDGDSSYYIEQSSPSLNLGYEFYAISDNATGYLSVPIIGAPKGTRCLKIRAVADNSTITSRWVQWCYSRATFDGDFIWDENTTWVSSDKQYYQSDTQNKDVIRGGHSIGLQMGVH